MAAKKVVVGAWLWWVVVGSAVLGFSWGFRSPKLFHTQSAMVQGRVVMLFPIMNGCRGLQRISFFRSGGGVLAASYSKGKLPSMVGALWSGRACGPPCVVGIENEGIALLSGCRAGRCAIIPQFGLDCIRTVIVLTTGPGYRLCHLPDRLHKARLVPSLETRDC